MDIADTDSSTALVAETTRDGWRLTVRRTRTEDDPNLPAPFAGWRHQAFVADRTGDAITLDADDRAHTTVEQVGFPPVGRTPAYAATVDGSRGV